MIAAVWQFTTLFLHSYMEMSFKIAQNYNFYIIDLILKRVQEKGPDLDTEFKSY